MKRLLLAVLTMIFTSSMARADFVTGSQTLAVFGGIGGSGTDYSYQPGTDRPVTGGGGAFGGQYLYYVKGSPAIALGADLTSSLNGDREDDDLLLNTKTTQRLKSVVGLAIAKLAYPRGVFRPYLFAGVGMHSSSQQLATETRMLIDEHKTSAALGAGIGFDVFPTESFFIGAELRGTRLMGLNTDDNPVLKNAGFNVRNERGITQGNILFRTGVKF